MNIARNALLNLAGGALPALLSLATIPLIVKGLGEAGYGLFTLITAIVGYFALIDINVTAGSVKFIAEYAARNDKSKLNQTFCFGLFVYLVIGFIGGAAIFFATPFLVRNVFEVPPAIIDIGEQSLRIASIGFLFGQLQAYLQSVPQALLRYDVTSRFEMLFGTVVPLMTVGILLAGYGLAEIIFIRVIASAINCLLLWSAIRKLIPDLQIIRPDRAIARTLVNFSAFSFLSRIAALTYAHADKLIIGASIGMKELAYYSVAATLANRVLGLTYRLSSVLFPTASALAASGETQRLRNLYLKATRYVAYINGSVLILVAVFAEPILHFWMNPEFARHGATILALVALAQFVDSLTNVPSLVNDGLGHPKVTGSFALARACVGLTAVYFLVKSNGIEGAAWAHLLSAALMTTLFLIFVHGRTVPCKLFELLSQSYARPMTIILLIAALTWALVTAAQMHLLELAVAMVVATTLLFVCGVLLVLLPSDRVSIKQKLRLWRAKLL